MLPFGADSNGPMQSPHHNNWVWPPVQPAAVRPGALSPLPTPPSNNRVPPIPAVHLALAGGAFSPEASAGHIVSPQRALSPDILSPQRALSPHSGGLRVPMSPRAAAPSSMSLDSQQASVNVQVTVPGDHGPFSVQGQPSAQSAFHGALDDCFQRLSYLTDRVVRVEDENANLRREQARMQREITHIRDQAREQQRAFSNGMSHLSSPLKMPVSVGACAASIAAQRGLSPRTNFRDGGFVPSASGSSAARGDEPSASAALVRKPRHVKVAKVPSPSSLRPKGTPRESLLGDVTRWSFEKRDGFEIVVSTKSKVSPLKVASKDVAIDLVKTAPHKYFGCDWTNNGYLMQAHVYPRSCSFFQDGFAQADQPEAWCALTAVYHVLPREVKVCPDDYTDGCLSTYNGIRYASRSPGRQQGLGDAPGLKLIGHIDPKDIYQGKIRDCCLLSAMSALAEFPGAIAELFKYNSYNSDFGSLPREEFNLYTVTLYDLSTWQPVNILVDERLAVTKDGDLLGCGLSYDNELWPCLLEKAVAAHCGGWDEIEGGTPTHAWRLLLGCNSVYTIRKAEDGLFYCFESDGNIENSPRRSTKHLIQTDWPETVANGADASSGLTDMDVFAGMCAWEDANFILCTSSHAGTGEKGNNYTILECLNNAGGTQIDIVKLRNPWGYCGECDCGQWEDGGSNWTTYPEVFEACGKPTGADDGVFWLERKDFFKHFNSIDLCATDMSRFQTPAVQACSFPLADMRFSCDSSMSSVVNERLDLRA